MNANNLDLLLSPATLGSLSLTNRVVMSPMSRSRAGEGDVATPLVAEYYRQRASAGLIVAECSPVSAQAKGHPRTPGIFTRAQIEGWRRVVDGVHQAGGRIFLQLWHAGRLSHSSVQPGGALPVAPSAIRADGEIATASGTLRFETPRALTTGEIGGIVEDFRRSSSNAKLAGFDGVEIHAGAGYLVDQFLRDGTNSRTDAYGGSVQNRARFLEEVVEAVMSTFSQERVGVRLSPVFSTYPMSDTDPAATFGHVADMLRQHNVAYLHVIQLGDDGFDFHELKRRFGGTYIANGGFDGTHAEAAIRAGDADLVSFGTLYAANPDLVERFRRRADLNTPDPSTFQQGEEHGYTDCLTLPS